MARNHNFSQEVLQEWVRLYNGIQGEKMSQRRIAERYGCSQVTVSLHLKKMGVIMRSVKEANNLPYPKRKLSEIAVLAMTEDAKHNLSVWQRGSKGPGWKGGNPDSLGYNYKFRAFGAEGKELQQFILERDNYECQDCNINCRGLKRTFNRHHIDFDKSNNSPDNIILLCNKCHSRRHVAYRRKINV